MKFIITVDVEADNQWKNNNIGLENVKSLPHFQLLCEKYGFKPTYLLSYEVVEGANIDNLKDWENRGVAEIGSHLHPWTTPPYSKNHNINIHTYPHELEEDNLVNKLESLTNIIKEKFNKQPISFRAGRWGFDERVAEKIKRLGYEIDCSVTPKINWQKTVGDHNKNGGSDFRFNSIYPHDIQGILEVPMTILFTGLLKKENSKIAQLFLRLPESFFKKVVNRLFFKQKWLRIFSNSSTKDWEMIYKSAQENNLPVLEFMIHSSELMIGGSPYSKDKKSFDFIYNQLEVMFKYFKEKDIEGITLSDFRKYFNN
jgi:hypothetical protein